MTLLVNTELILFCRGPVRPLIYQYFERDPDIYLVKGHMREKDYMRYWPKSSTNYNTLITFCLLRALKTSKFCLCPRGHKGWSPRVMDALWFGCIPVFLADHYVPPLYELIPWQAVSLAIPESQVGCWIIFLGGGNLTTMHIKH